MRTLTSFQFITLNGFFEDAAHRTDWALQSQEQRNFALEKLKGDNILLFGRLTYEHMLAWWPTGAARQMDPEMAAGMNNAEKIVFSNTLKEPAWEPTRIVSGDIVAETRKLKESQGKNLALLGSGSILALFAEHQLIDEFQFMINPVALGAGRPALGGIPRSLKLRLLSTRAFPNGVVLLTYIPAKPGIPEEGR